MFLSLGVMLTGTFVVTPLLIVLLLFTNDFVTMAIAADRAPASPRPVRWNVRTLVATAAPIAALVLALSFSVFFAARDGLRLPLPQLQTLVFLMLVFSGQGLVYLLRTGGHFWTSRPGRWLLTASVVDIAAVCLMAVLGILMAPVPLGLVLGLLAIVAAFLVALDFVKVRVFERVGLVSRPVSS